MVHAYDAGQQRRDMENSVPDNPHRRQLVGLLFVAPFALLFVFVFVIPICYALYISFFQQRLMGGNSFVGLANYRQVLADKDFWDAVIRIVGFTLVQVPLMLLMALILALALDSRRMVGLKVVRIASFLPYAVPAVVSTLMWGFMLGVRYGLFKDLNDALHTHIDPFAPNSVMVSIGVMILWTFTGYNMLIFYSSLQAIPMELYEAATIDGASDARIVWTIKLPALRNSIAVTVIFSIIGTFQLFNEPKILQGMVSGTGITSHYTPNMYAYSLAFNGSQQNYAAAVAIVMAVITIAIAYAVQLHGMKDTLK